ncbi:MAG: outer membrane protein assembly factor BamD [Gammaproteobacteria bacterium]|nr:outer membrane protein assembly factor BamD [Gammaproteobacteria bacterium]
MRLTFILLFSLFISACSDDATKEDPYSFWSAKDFYDAASHSLSAGEFQEAISNLESLEARFPFSPYARQSQLDVAYAYYKFEEPDSAISAADRFLRLNPRDPNVDYAWYLKGLANFSRGQGFLDSWFPRDLSQHDTKTLNDAIRDFSTLVRRYPDSKYAGDAYQRLLYLRNKLAEHEIHVAEYYIKRKAWLAAAKRAQYTIEHYQKTPAARRALEIMVQAYKELGLTELMAGAQLVLDANRLEEVKTADIMEDTLEAPRMN